MKPSLKNFWKPTPKKLKKIAWSVKAFTASAGITALANDMKWLALSIAILGGLADLFIELFSDDSQP